MIRKLFRQMLVTQILSAMTVMLCMLVDSMMIGRFLGVDSMTAYGLANPVLLIFAAYVAAVLIGFSRLYLFLHFPTDVFAGAVMGIALGFAADRITALAAKKLKR